MTHIFLLAEGYPEGMKNMVDDWQKYCVYRVNSGANNEVHGLSGISIRELRLYDIVVKEDAKERFLSDIKPIALWSYKDDEAPRPPEGQLQETPYILHGADGKGFKIGVFRRLVQWCLRAVNASIIDWDRIKPNVDSRLSLGVAEDLKNKVHKPWHCHFMILGELRDGFTVSGKNKGRENTWSIFILWWILMIP